MPKMLAKKARKDVFQSALHQNGIIYMGFNSRAFASEMLGIKFKQNSFLIAKECTPEI